MNNDYNNWLSDQLGRQSTRDVLMGLLFALILPHRPVESWTKESYAILEGMTDRIMNNQHMHCIDYPEKIRLQLFREEGNGSVFGTIGGEVLDLAKSLSFVNHSPTGFNWGYGGSGPAQLALACCLVLFPYPLALRLYQRFKADIIAGLPQADDSVDMEVDLHGFLSGHVDVISDYQTQLLREGLLS